MKLKRIFMTGVLASSMLALAACGDDVEGKPAEETPAEEKEKEVDPVETEKPLTLSEALTALNNFNIEEYLQKLVNDYTGENSYVNITTSSKDYEYDKSTDTAPSKTYDSNGNYIVTLDDATKIYGKSFDGEYGETEYASIVAGLQTLTSTSTNDISHTFKDLDSYGENVIEKLIASSISDFVFGGNVLESALPLAEKADLVKGKVLTYLSGKVKSENGVEVIDVPAILADVKGEVDKQTSTIDAGATLLSLAAPFIISPAQVEDETDLTTIHDTYPMGFIYLDYDLTDTMTIELSVDNDLLAMVLDDNKNKTIAEFIAAAYSTEDAPLEAKDIVAMIKTGRFGSILGLLQQALSTTGKDINLAGIIEKYSETPISYLSGFAPYLDFNLSYALLEGTFATKVNFPMVNIPEDPSAEPEVTPMFAYLSYANGEFVTLYGVDKSDGDADAEALAGYKAGFGVAEDDELLIRDFIGNKVMPLAYVTYLADADDATKSVLNVMDMYKAYITRTETGLEADVQTVKLDNNGKPVSNNGEPVYEKVGSVSYSNDETGTIFDAYYGAYVTNKQNEEEFVKMVSLTYANTVADGFSFNAYYNNLATENIDYSLDVTNNTITFVKPGKIVRKYVDEQLVTNQHYEVIELKFNTEDELFAYSLNEYDEYPAKDANLASVSTKSLSVKAIENGYELDQTTTRTDDNYSNDVVATITKEVKDKKAVYTLNIDETTVTEKINKVSNINVVLDEATKSLEFSRTTDKTGYKIDDNKQKVVDYDYKNSNAVDLKITFDETNKKIVSEYTSNNYYGQLDEETKVEITYATNAEAKAALIQEVTDAQEANKLYDLALTADQIKQYNSELDVYNYDEDKIGKMSKFDLTIDKEKNIVLYNGLVSRTVDSIYGTYVNGYSISGLALEFSVKGDLDLTNYHHNIKDKILYLYTTNNEITSDITGIQTITNGTEVYDVTYSEDKYIIIDREKGADVTTEFLANNPSVEDKLDDYLNVFKSKSSKLDDSVVDEISFDLEAKNQ